MHYWLIQFSILKGEKRSGSREVMKKGNTVEKTLLCYKKKYLKLLLCIQLAHVCKR